MARISMQGHGDINQIAGSLTRDIESSGMSCTLVDSISRSGGSCRLVVLVFEKYYMRTSNRASLTVVLTGQDQVIYADAIGSGGGQGAIFRFSWGAEENFVSTAERFLRQYGFQ